MDLSDLMPSSGGTRKWQVFNASGTFTPSAKLLARGGAVQIIAIGGGSTGGDSNCGDGALPINTLVTVSGPVTVTIGAGGAPGATGSPGGNTTFGALATAPGAPAGTRTPGFGAGGAPLGTGVSDAAGAGVLLPMLGAVGGGGGVNNTFGMRYGGAAGGAGGAAPNKGGGASMNGYGGQPGGSGALVVIWEE